MNNTNNDQNNVLFSLDIGTRTVIGTIGVVRDKKFYIIDEAVIEHDERAMIDGQIHDISLVAQVVSKVKKQLESRNKILLNNVCIAAAGRFLKTLEVKYEFEIDSNIDIDRELIRSLELTAVKKAEMDFNNVKEGKLYCVGYSVKNYYLNGYSISNLLNHRGEKIAVEVITTFLPRSVVDSLYKVMDMVSLNVKCLTLEPIAALEAIIPKKLRLLNIALVDIGAGTSDIAICSNDSISAYGMVPQAGDEVTESIAKNYLVDFNQAEKIKKNLLLSDKIQYIDVLGFENEVDSKPILNLISPIVKKITDEVGRKIIDLNNGKSPSAVFLVGGGAHTPFFKDYLAEILELPIQRIAIKARDGVEDCINQDINLGSMGVTVLGIALVSLKELGHDFLDVNLNGSVISLFNARRHTVMDVLIQGGINPKVLIPRNGKNIKFVLNDIKRTAFGSIGKNSTIHINGISGNIESEIKEGDNIIVTFAVDGLSPEPLIKDYINEVYSISFYLNDEVNYIEPEAYINDVRVPIDSRINENDEVKIYYPRSFGDFLKTYSKNIHEYNYYIEGKIVSEDYIIKEGDKIRKESKQEVIVEKENYEDNIKIIVNEDEVILKGKSNYVFIDIFNFYAFDLTTPKGTIQLLLNDKTASYHDTLVEGDKIVIKWI